MGDFTGGGVGADRSVFGSVKDRGFNSRVTNRNGRGETFE
jgi:hypothetical protein